MRRTSSTVPFGYKLDLSGNYLEEIPTELKELTDIVDSVHKGYYSLREGADILTATTGRYISHTGLRKIMHARLGNKP